MGKGALEKAVLFLVSFVFLAGGAAAVHGQSALDGFDPNANGIVRVVVVQPDGKILLGGDFTTLAPNGGMPVARNRIARLNPDGTLDTAFDPNAGGIVFAIALQPDGKILVGGLFGAIGGAIRNRIARLEATTGQADSFDPKASGAVYAIAVQADGKILIGGTFNGSDSVGGQARNHLARLDAANGLADPFNPNPNAAVRAIVVQADGKILAGGDFHGANSIGGQTRNYIARLDPTTGGADSFNPSANDLVRCIAVQADGKILAGGAFAFGPSPIGGQPRDYLARLDPITGQADSFNPSAGGEVNAIVVQPDGRILVGGGFPSMGGQPRNNITRLDATTGLAEDLYNPSPNNLVVNTIAVQLDGKILIGGDFTSLGAKARNRIARLEINGAPDQTFDPGLTGANGVAVFATAVQPDGKILVGGEFDSVKGLPRENIARLNNDGTLNLDFRPSANDDVNAIALQTDGQVLIGGFFTSVGGQPRNNIARLNLDGSVETLFNPDAKYSDPNVPSFIYAIAVQADGKILVGGRFDSIGGQPRAFIARLNPDGTPDSFSPNASGIVQSIVLQEDGKILVGGNFTTISGEPRNRIARLHPDGTLDTAFHPDANGSVYCFAVQPDGRILIGGNFRTIGGQGRDRIARLDATTGAPDSFNPSADDGVRSLAVQADGRILAGGYFTDIGGKTRNRMARLDPTTGLADSFNPDPGGTSLTAVYSIAQQGDGKVLAGGDFTVIGGRMRHGIARLTNDAAARQDLAATQTAVTWMLGDASPQFARVTFEYSTDNGNYTPLGHGTAAGSNWTLSGLNLPTQQNFYIRARGYHRGSLNNGSESIQESVRNAFLLAPTPGLVGNVATRLPVGTGDNVLIEGFIVLGPNGSTKKIMVRALGPFLTQFGVPDALPNPTLEIRDGSNTVIATNNDWKNTQLGGIIPSDQVAEIQGSGLAPGNDLESAIIANLAPGSYTAVVSGVNNTVGTGIVDAYDMSPASPARLANIATRGLIQPADKLMIAGFITQNGDVRAVVRAIGPSLSAFGITNALPDTTLQLRDVNGAIVRENDDWQSDQKVELEATGLQPGNALEAAMVATLPPGQYTAQVRGKPETTGIGVVEVYFLQ